MDDGLEEFEKTLAAEKQAREEEKSKERDRHRHRHHRSRHHRSRDDEEDRHRHRRSRDDDEDGHRHKRRHKDGNERDDDERRRRRRREGDDRADDRKNRHEKTTDPKEDLPLPDEEEPQNEQLQVPKATAKRDSWMTAPDALEFDYTQRGAKKVEQSNIGGGAQETLELKIHKNE